jgi:ABC-type uncharacterized transport system involved in gliding motility auxiliary subunit
MNMESFRAARWMRTINLVLQALLFTSFFAGLNYLAIHYSWRSDLTRSHRNSLSPETQSYLRGLERPVRAIVTIGSDFSDPEQANDIRALLREFAYTTDANTTGNRITVENLDIYQRPRDARELGVEQANSVFFLCGDKRRIIALPDLYRMERGEKKAFIGEQVFTSAILDVSDQKQKKIYFLTGHGEHRLDVTDKATGLSDLGNELKMRNFAVDPLDISFTRKVPDDADLLIIAAPERVEPFVQEQLRQYLSKNAGRIILLLSTRVPHGLDDLLLDWGVLAHDVVICDRNPESITEEQDLKIGAYGDHSITQTLRDRNLFLRLGETRCINPSPDKVKGSGLNITTLAATSSANSAWGERNYRGQLPYVYDAGVDLKGGPNTIPQNCLGVAVASERVQARGLPFTVRGGRLVVFGSADLVVNERIRGTPGNENIFLNSVNWAVDRDTQLTILARPIEKYQIALSQEELSRLRYMLWFGLPAVAALLGLIVTWTRRH